MPTTCRPARNYAAEARAARDFANQPYAHHAIARREAMERALSRPAMKKARAIVQRLHADMCAVRPNWGMMPDPLSRQHYATRLDRAKQRYQRAFDRYHNVMRPAAMRCACK